MTKYITWGIGLLCLFATTNIIAQPSTRTEVDSLELQQVSLQDTFLLRIIPEYIATRLREPNEKRFQQKGVIIVTIPQVRQDTIICYRIQTEYDNYGIIKASSIFHPLFYTEVAGRLVIVCDEWTGSLVPLSRRSVQRAIDKFAKSGWLYVVNTELDSHWELHNAVYCWRFRP